MGSPATAGGLSLCRTSPHLQRDRDAIFGHDLQEQVRDMGIREVLSAPRPPWQRSLYRAGDWLDSSGVPRSCDRVPRRLATKNAPIVLRVLPSIENASFVAKGRARATSNSAAGNGDRGGRSAGRWPAPSVRTAGRLKKRPESSH